MESRSHPVSIASQPRVAIPKTTELRFLARDSQPISHRRCMGTDHKSVGCVGELANQHPVKAAILMDPRGLSNNGRAEGSPLCADEFGRYP